MTHYYDQIPIEKIGKNILEIGIHPRILESKIWPKIAQGNYLGIDSVIRFKSELNVIKANILDYNIKKKYDTIILIEVLEHIHFGEWEKLIIKLKNALIKDGYLIISTPYNQLINDYLKLSENQDWDLYQTHTVFGINQEVMKYFFPGCEIKLVRRIKWREDNCNLIWAIGRFLKRYFFGINPISKVIMIFWKK